MKNFMLKFGTVIASFALLITNLNVNNTCLFVAHQPKLPEGAKSLSRFKK